MMEGIFVGVIFVILGTFAVLYSGSFKGSAGSLAFCFGCLIGVVGFVVLFSLIFSQPIPTKAECAKCNCLSACENQGMQYKESGIELGEEYCICEPARDVRIYG